MAFHQLSEAIDERAKRRERGVGEGVGGVAEEQVAVRGVHSGQEQGEGEDKFFGVERGASARFGVGWSWQKVRTRA